jgi:hypothetical protein
MILEDFVNACDPLSVELEGDFQRAGKYQDDRARELQKAVERIT